MMPRIRPLLLALLALLSAGALHAQPSLQTVRGRVVDAATNQPVSTASVRVVEESGEAAVTGQTDFGGRFNIRLPIAGTYRVTAERIGFAVQTSEPFVVARGANVDVELRMTPVAVALESVNVRVRETPPFRDARAARFWERADRRRGVYLTPEQIAGKPYVATTDLLRDMQGIYLEGDPTRGTQLYLGVSAIRRCVPTLYIDGLRRRIEQDERLDDYVDRKNLWAVEVYAEPSDAPSELPPDDNFRCGVVVIWTRNA
ncbi:MAG TPA: carboxypeptidase-like regulatory domain-containing protein [Longimicrobium sp.]|nr:carboxypeptidase-like regulatory domain-containing protein [Longimicrobium sp.]